ncbi:intradiol ring-cleavage dioxygenase [Streptomyces sp. NA02950]|uniref:intradiol ring-cleavage dioxygenase n=1 Tax=Streptomyces sp. NA02950 TaxID=2742137 RepID=UPI00159153B3|nr:intradiol ring-cleavage dioxygenase [Streptomyces sp. NA02950]QKV92477.1 intradiol ring-cleavage dioxygenase [Streptomyces sp. NA02950]
MAKDKQHTPSEGENAPATPGPNRRKILTVIGGAGLGVAGVAAYAAQASAGPESSATDAAATGSPTADSTSRPQCLLTAEQMSGPYYLEDEKVRRDITEKRPGVPLALTFQVVDTKTCKPLSDAAVDIWHCDAGGVYAGYTAISPDEPYDPSKADEHGHVPNTDETTFLRGIQLTDRDGKATFKTIFPGWYYGRTTHIHLKVHYEGDVRGGTYEGGHVAHTGQVFFSDKVADAIAKLDPYAKHTGTERVVLADDHVAQSAGSASLVSLAQVRPGRYDKGLTGSIVLGVDPDATPPEAGGRPPRPSASS